MDINKLNRERFNRVANEACHCAKESVQEGWTKEIDNLYNQYWQQCYDNHTWSEYDKFLELFDGTDEDDDIDVAFNKMSKEDQDKVIDFLKAHLKKSAKEDVTLPFEQQTKQGYKVVKLRPWSQRFYAILQRPNDYVVAAGYEPKTGEWAQGYYDFVSIKDAEDKMRELTVGGTHIQDSTSGEDEQFFDGDEDDAIYDILLQDDDMLNDLLERDEKSADEDAGYTSSSGMTFLYTYPSIDKMSRDELIKLRYSLRGKIDRLYRNLRQGDGYEPDLRYSIRELEEKLEYVSHKIMDIDNSKPSNQLKNQMYKAIWDTIHSNGYIPGGPIPQEALDALKKLRENFSQDQKLFDRLVRKAKQRAEMDD